MQSGIALIACDLPESKHGIVFLQYACSSLTLNSARFYVKTSVMPPQVSMTHPLDASTVSPPRQASPPGTKPGLSPAQQLFASSQKGSGIAPPTLRSLPPTSQISFSPDGRTPPLSASSSPVPGAAGLTLPYEARLTIDGAISKGNTPSTSNGQLNQGLGVAVQRSSASSPLSPASSPQTLNANTVAQAQNLSNAGYQQVPSNLHRAHSYQTAPGHMRSDSIPQPNRSMTYSAGVQMQLQRANQPPTLNISMTARPPAYSQHIQINNPTGSPTPPQQLSPNIPATAYAAAQNAAFLNNALQSPVQNPQDLQVALQAAQTAAALKTASQMRTKDATYALKQMGKAIGKSTTKAAKKITQGAIMVTTGINTAAVGKAIMNSDAVTSLITAFPSLQSQAGINAVQLQAVLQGQPGADYQAMINALTLQQRRQQQNPSQGHKIDYQALINEIRRLQLIANQNAVAQQQALIQQKLAQQKLAQALAQQQQNGGVQQNTILQLQVRFLDLHPAASSN